jgi:hypothetical protein
LIVSFGVTFQSSVTKKAIIVRRKRPVSFGASATEEDAMLPSRKSLKPSPENWPEKVYELFWRVPRYASAR